MDEKIIKTIDGIEWGKWILSSTSKNKHILDNYFNKFMIYFNMIITDEYFDLPNDDNKYHIKQQVLKRYKASNNENTLLLDIELLIYRDNKPLARHLKILVITNGIYNNVIMAKVIGVINEFNLTNKYKTLDDSNNNSEFEPEFKYKYDMNSFIYDTNEKLVHSEIEYNLYNKLLKEL